jgi:hypothetical protein
MPDYSMKKVIFLDIDGVLQPCGSQKRFDHTENNVAKLGIKK